MRRHDPTGPQASAEASVAGAARAGWRTFGGTRARLHLITTGAPPIDEEPDAMLEITVGDLTFDALEWGPEDGELVLLLHGFPQSASTWGAIGASLGHAGYRAVAPNQRGYARGARPASRRAYALDHLVGDVLDMADALDADRFHLVGHDWGGIVGWALAASTPERVASFTSLATPHPAALVESLMGPQALKSAYIGFFRAPLVPEIVLTAAGGRLLRLMLQSSGLAADWAAQYAGALDAEGCRAALAWYRATNLRRLARVGPVSVPTMFVWGQRDAALGRIPAEATGSRVLAPYRFEELDASHWLPEECPRLMASLILGHLDEWSED